MTKHLMLEMERLKMIVSALAELVEQSVDRAVIAVLQRDTKDAQEIIDRDSEIDVREIAVEEECLKVLALHQPVAIDLRLIVACLKINNDLERIGDLAVNIAHRAQGLAALPDFSYPFDLRDESARVQQMLRESLAAVVALDPEKARAVIAADETIDQINRENHRCIVKCLREDREQAEGYLLLLSVSRHLERIADHATNIAEDVVYLVEGEIVRHAGRGREGR